MNCECVRNRLRDGRTASAAVVETGDASGGAGSGAAAAAGSAVDRVRGLAVVPFFAPGCFARSDARTPTPA